MHNRRITSLRGNFLYSFDISNRSAEDVGMHSHLESSLVYVEEGDGFLKLRDRTLPLHRGDVVLIRNREPHLIMSQSDVKPMTALAFNFFPSALITYAPDYVDCMLGRIFYSTTVDFDNILPAGNGYVKEMIHAIAQIKAELLVTTPNLYALRVKFLNVLSRIPDIVDVTAYSPDDVTEKHKNTILSSLVYMYENLTNDISLADLAKQANMEVSHYCSVFKSFQGKSPWKYFLTLRIELATEYLKDGKNAYSISAIADMTGFNNLSNFNKIFKSIVGMTPSQYRKQHK